MNVEKNHRFDTDILRCIAILLILNSHLDLYYPVRYIGTGGAIGNALFFMLSSFGLLISERTNPRSFPEWFTRRIMRIYPPVWATLLLIIIPVSIFVPVDNYFNIGNAANILDFANSFFYPPFWFLRALMLFYFCSFFLIKKFNYKKTFIVLGITLIAYFYCYFKYLDLSTFCIEDLPFKLLFYFMAFILGIILADNTSRIKYSGIIDFVYLFSSIFLIYVHKYLMTKNILCAFQFIQHFLIFVAVYYFLKISRSEIIPKYIFRFHLSNFVNYISGLTLEIYIVHTAISPVILKMNYRFPLNVIVLLAVTFTLSSIVKYSAKRIVSTDIFQVNA